MGARSLILSGRTELAAGLTGVQVGAALVISRAIVDTVDPVPLGFLRYMVGALVLLLFALRVGPWPGICRREFVPIALCGIIQSGLLIVLLNAGLQTVPAAPASLAFATIPLLALAPGIALGRERWAWRRGVAIGGSELGLAIALGAGATTLPDGASSGLVMILAAAACGAGASVWVGPCVRRYGALPVSMLALLAATIALGLWSLPGGPGVASDVLRLEITSGVVALGLGSGLGYILWLWALGRASASHVTVYQALGPITAAILGAVLLGEIPALTTVAGMVVIIASLRLSARVPSPRSATTSLERHPARH